jgi:hypothetical protein
VTHTYNPYLEAEIRGQGLWMGKSKAVRNEIYYYKNRILDEMVN